MTHAARNASGTMRVVPIHLGLGERHAAVLLEEAAPASERVIAEIAPLLVDAGGVAVLSGAVEVGEHYESFDPETDETKFDELFDSIYKPLLDEKVDCI